MEDLPVEAGMGENGGVCGEKDDEFYETIEAPKFVDFTLPILPLLDDDRSWFCSRVGCDQKHEQDMDSETIYRNFVLRVMAARSPNVKLGKALSKQSPIGIPKCPLSAPPKSSRVPKLAVISSISQIHGAKVKFTHISSKFRSTPIGKKSQGNKEEVQDIKPCGNVVKGKMTSLKEKKGVAKALVFSSPGKKGKQGTSNTSVANITSDMKKLKISRQAKIVPSRYASSSGQAKPSSNACIIAKSKQVRSSIASKDTGNQKAIVVRKKIAGKGKEKKSNGKLSGIKRDVTKFDGNMGVEEKASRNSSRVLDVIEEECLPPMETSIEKGKSADTRNGSSMKETNIAMEIVKFDKSCVESTFLESTDLIDAIKDSMPLIREQGSGVCEINKQVIENETMEKEKIADTRNGSSMKETNLAMAMVNFDNADESCVESTFLKSTDLIDATKDSMPLLREERNGVCEINKQVIETETMESADKEITAASYCNSVPLIREERNGVCEITAASYCNSMPLIREERNGVCEINKQVIETETMESADKESTAASYCSSMPLIREEYNGVCEINKQIIETKTMESADKESTADSYCNSMPLIREEGNGVCEINKQVAETERMEESADKENTAASDCNRNINLNSIDAERSTKQFKEGVLVPNQGGKIRKVKPTNPKPFRLRTDERSILKEANLEKRRMLQPIVSSYYAPDSKTNNESTKDEKRMQVQARSANVKSTGRKASKADNRAILNIKNEGKNITTKRTENRPANSEQLTRTASSDKNTKCSVSKNQMCDSIRSTSRGKRPPTIPKEPVFRQIHVPKSCTKNKI